MKILKSIFSDCVARLRSVVQCKNPMKILLFLVLEAGGIAIMIMRISVLSFLGVLAMIIIKNLLAEFGVKGMLLVNAVGISIVMSIRFLLKRMHSNKALLPYGKIRSDAGVS